MTMRFVTSLGIIKDIKSLISPLLRRGLLNKSDKSFGLRILILLVSFPVYDLISSVAFLAFAVMNLPSFGLWSLTIGLMSLNSLSLCLTDSLRSIRPHGLSVR